MDNAKRIWDFLRGVGLNGYAAAGLMGNLYAESCLNPQNLQNSYESRLHMTDAEYTAAVDSGEYKNFDEDAAGYGLAQWTFSARKHNLRAYCLNAGKSIGDLDAQLGFLWQELQGYTKLLDILRTAKSVREASDAVLTMYERPADQSDAMKARRAGYGEDYYRKFEGARDVTPSAKKTGKEFMTAERLIELLKYAAGLKTIYMYAAYGFQVTTATINKKAKQNLNGWYTAANIAKLRKVANENPPTWGFDCVNLLKGILWGWTGDTSKVYGGAVYGAHGVPDTNANGMIKRCYEVSDDFSMGLVPGEGLWCEGHWGTYIGGGLAVECTTRWKDKVQTTAVLNIGNVAGYNGRRWTKHGKLPWIAYDNVLPDQPVTPDKPGESRPTLKRGSAGATVQQLQRDLIKLGYDVGPDGADGEFGANTDGAVRAFQRAHGLMVDGIVGAKTWAALDRALGESEAAKKTITVKAGTWHIRSGPGTEYKSLGIVKGGDVLETTGEQDGRWMQVRHHGGTAWISGKAVVA